MSLEKAGSIHQAVVDGRPEDVSRLVANALDEGRELDEVLYELVGGIREVGSLFGEGVYFLPDLVLGAEAMKAGMALVSPKLAEQRTPHHYESKGKVVLGTVKGDLHDIGKSLVGLMLEVGGLEVSDLGVDVPADRFVAEAERTGAQVIALSSLLTTTAPYMRTIISTVRESSIGEKCAIVIGGAATSSAFAEDISADGWAENAVDAVKLVEGLISLRTS